MKRPLFLALWIVLLPITAWAHPGHGESGFVNGVLHPFSGLDHVLGMLAVGVWASRNSDSRRWFAPAAFLGGMLAGGVMGLDGMVPMFIESAVAASVVAAALLVILAVRMPLLAQGGWRCFLQSGTALRMGRNYRR